MRAAALPFMQAIGPPVRSGPDEKGARLTPGALSGTRLADRDAVLQAALRPEGVLAALDLQLRALADVLLEALAVVADVLDDPEAQSLVRPIGLAELALACRAGA